MLAKNIPAATRASPPQVTGRTPSQPTSNAPSMAPGGIAAVIRNSHIAPTNGSFANTVSASRGTVTIAIIKDTPTRAWARLALKNPQDLRNTADSSG